MLMWRRLGHASHSEWKRATAKSRRESKTAARKAVVAMTPPTVQWQPVQVLPTLPAQQPGLAGMPPDLTPSSPPPGLKTGGLSGRLFEDVQVTPRGRRKHIFKHVSPGGTNQADEYFSPAGETTCGQRLACLRRIESARRATAPDRAALAAARELRLQASFEAEVPRSRSELKVLLKQQSRRLDCKTSRCDDCAACKRVYGEGKRGNRWRRSGRMHAPCEVVLHRIGCRRSEFKIAYELLFDPACSEQCCNMRVC